VTARSHLVFSLGAEMAEAGFALSNSRYHLTRAQDFRSRPQEIEKIGARVEALLPTLRGTWSVFAQPTQTGYFLDIDWKPEELARNGLAHRTSPSKYWRPRLKGTNVSTGFRGPVSVADWASLIGPSALTRKTLSSCFCISISLTMTASDEDVSTISRICAPPS
jgi:hypothetical protein